MINNVNGMVKINENIINGQTTPKGFIVRERIVDGKAVSLEYGIYLTDTIFLGIPVHFSMKNKFIASNSHNTEEYNYYLLPESIQFAVSSYTSKKTNKVNPLLVEPSEKCPAVLVSALAFGNNIDKVIDVKIRDDSKVLRKFIDKDRNCIGIIVYNPNTDVINPSTVIDVKYGKLGSDLLNIKTYKFDCTIPTGVEINTFTEGTNNLSIEFISLPMAFETPKSAKDEVSESDEGDIESSSTHKSKFNKHRKGSKGKFNKNRR